MGTIRKTVIEVVLAVTPTAVVITILLAMLGSPGAIVARFLVGALMVAAGFVLFMIGVHLGLLQIGEGAGAALPKTGSAWIVLFFGFLFGFVVTVAEPDVRVLATQVDLVSRGAIPKGLLVATVGLGVGIFVALGMWRVFRGFSMKLIMSVSYTLLFVFAAFTPGEFAAVALDSGGVTTGPITTPFIIALGVGVASVLGGRRTSVDGFGFVGLGSIGPILAVLLLGVMYG